MIKNISFEETKSFLKKYIFSEFLLYEFDNKDLYGVFSDENLSSVIIKSGEFCYMLSDSLFDMDEIKVFIQLNGINEIISNKKLNFIKGKSCYLMTRKIEIFDFKSRYNYSFENNMNKIKYIYENLKSYFSLPEFDEFYMSLFYKNKNDKLRLYGIFEEEKCISSAILFLLNEDYVKLTSVATNPDFQKRGYGQKIIFDICHDLFLNNRILYLLCEKDYVFDFYKKMGFVLTEKLYLHKVEY